MKYDLLINTTEQSFMATCEYKSNILLMTRN